MPKSEGSPASPQRFYRFFKIFLPNLSSTHMRIPPAFQPYVECHAPARFYLKGPSEYSWGVDLVKKSDGLFFTDGWEQFASDHSLSAGDFLLFKYNGSLTFSVMVFDNTACEKVGAFLARPMCDEKGIAPSESAKEEGKEKPFAGLNQSAKRKRTLLENNDCGEAVLERMLSIRTQAGQTLISGKLDIGGNSKLFNKAIECSSHAKLKKQGKTKDGSRKKVLRGFLSQRRPITQKEKDLALEKAQSFRSNKPWMMMVMKGSYVYHGFYLRFPGSFPLKHLPDHSGDIYLHDPNKKQWTVKYIFATRGPALSGGWGKFAVGNNLEMDDVCVFEIIEKTHIKVHVFRVLEDIKPLLRSARLKKLCINGE